MKSVHLIAPVLALAGSAIWIHQQESSLIELEEKTTVLQNRIAETKKIITANGPDSRNASTEKNTLLAQFRLADGNLDWKSIAETMLQENNYSMTDTKTMMQLQAAVMKMSVEELIENLSLIRSLDLPAAVGTRLQTFIIERLSKKNPALALEALSEIKEGQDGSHHWLRRHAFDELAKKDPSAAEKWLEAEIAKGSFPAKALDPGKNPVLEFESRLIANLLTSDPAKARARLSALSEIEREGAFKDRYSWRVKGKLPKGYNAFIRENFPEDKAIANIANAYGSINHDTLESLDKSLEGVDFTPKEKAAVIRSGFENFLNYGPQTQNRLEEAYQWAKTKVPEEASGMTAKALAQKAFQTSNYKESFQTALAMAEEHTSPEIAVGFVQASSNRGDNAISNILPMLGDQELKDKFQAIYDSLQTDEPDVDSE